MIPPFPHLLLAASQPFSGLGPAARQTLTQQARLQTVDAGESILLRPGSSLLLLVDGQGLLKDAQGNRIIMLPGELAGYETLVGEREVPTLIFVAQSDGHVLLFPQQALAELIEQRNEESNYVKHWLEQAARRRVEAFAARCAPLQAEGALWRLSLRELTLAVPLWVYAHDSVAELAARMSAMHRFAALVRQSGQDGQATDAAHDLGIVTERDVLLKVVAKGLDPKTTPVSAIMSAPVACVDVDAPVFEAVALMVAKSIRRLAVRTGETVAALVEENELMALRGANPITLAAVMNTARSPEELAASFVKTAELASRSVQEGVMARQVARLVSTLHGHLLNRAAELCTKSCGHPKGDFAVLALGAEGRGEAFLATDQDNALVYSLESDADWAVAFGSCFSETLSRIGYPDCPEGIMLARPDWRAPLSQWQDKLTQAVANPDAKSVVFVSLLADARCVAGSKGLGATLQQTLFAALAEHPLTLRYLAREALRMPAPLNFLGNIATEKNEQGQAVVDVKKAAIFPIAQAVKALALRFRVHATSSFARLEALCMEGHLSMDMAQNLLESFDFVLQLRLRAQSAALAKGLAPGNLVVLSELSSLERDRLRDAFKVVMDVRKLLESSFSLRLLP